MIRQSQAHRLCHAVPFSLPLTVCHSWVAFTLEVMPNEIRGDGTRTCAPVLPLAMLTCREAGKQVFLALRGAKKRARQRAASVLATRRLSPTSNDAAYAATR